MATYTIYQDVEKEHPKYLLGTIHIDFSENISDKIYVEKCNLDSSTLNVLELKLWDEMYFNELEDNLNKSQSFKKFSKEISEKFKIEFCGNDLGLKLSNKTKRLELFYGLVYSCEVESYKENINKIINYLKFLEIFDTVIQMSFELLYNKEKKIFKDMVYCRPDFKLEF